MKTWLPWIVCLCLALAGCSDPTQGIVRGTVTVDGALAESGSVAFFPVDGNSPVAGAQIDEEGNYEATVAVGVARVEIRISEFVGGSRRLYNTKDSETQDIREEILPAKYNDESELEYDVPAGKSEKHFDLERIPKR